MARHQADEEQDDDWDDDDAYDDDSFVLVDCPYCREEIPEDAEQCPRCGRYISLEDSPPDAKPWWLVLTAIICLIGMFLWMFM